MSNRYSLIATALAVLAITYPTLASSAPTEVTFARFPLRIDPGPGYCQLDEHAHERDRRVFEEERNAQRNNDVVAIFGDCDELTAFRLGTDRMHHFALVLATHQIGRVQQVPSTTRAKFLKDIIPVLTRRAQNLDAEEVTRQRNEAMDPETREEVGQVTIGKAIRHEVFDADEHAVYFAMVTPVESAGQPQTKASVIGFTLIAGYPLTYGLYGDYLGQSTLDAMLADLRPIMAYLVANNDPLDLPTDAFAPEQAPLTMEQVLEAYYEQDYETAVEGFRYHAEQGAPVAQILLARSYVVGLTATPEPAAALPWYQLAAEQGEPTAQHELAVMHDLGIAVEENDEEALRWYRSSAEQDDPRAQNAIGSMHLTGHMVEQDYAQALHWFTLSAEHDYPDAQTNLGYMHQEGLGVPRNSALARHWFDLAAKQGDAKAQYNLAVLHDRGEGTPEDDLTAFSLYEKAAHQGVPEAQNNLGLMYASGQGIPGHPVTGYAWLTVAAAQGIGAAREAKEVLAKQMTRQQLETARAAAHELWTAYVAPFRRDALRTLRRSFHYGWKWTMNQPASETP